MKARAIKIFGVFGGVSLFFLFAPVAVQAAEPSTSATQQAELTKTEERELLLEQTKFATEDTGTAEPGTAEIKVTYFWKRARKGWDKEWSLNKRGLRSEQNTNLDLTVGLIHNFEVVTNMSYIVLEDKDYDYDADDEVDGPKHGNGFSDLPIAVKWRFYNNQKRHLSLAYVPGFTIHCGQGTDLGEIGTTQNYASFDEKMVLSKEWGRWAFSTDVGYVLPFGHERRKARGTLTSNTAIGYQVFKFLQPEVELNYAHDFVETDDDTNQFAVSGALLLPFHSRFLAIVGIQQDLFGDNVDRDFLLKSSLTYYYG